MPMWRKITLVIVTFLTLGAIWSGGIYNARVIKNTKLPLTNIHKNIAQERDWLNVSRPITAEDLRGRIILLDFWTFCCINCMHIVPDLRYLEHTFGDNLTVVGVHSAKFLNEKDNKNIRSAILRYGIEHPVVNDADFKIWQSFGVTAWPSLILINPLGKIEELYSGEGHRDEIESDIKSLIEEYKDHNKRPLPMALEKDKLPEQVLNFPGKIAYAPKVPALSGQEVLFIADSSNNRILAVNPESAKIIDIYGGFKAGFKDARGSKALFSKPQGMAYDNNNLYVADTGNHAVRKIDLITRDVTTIAGTGKQGFNRRVSNVDGRDADLASPWDIEFYPDKRHLIIAMAGLHQLWIYDLITRKIGVLAGNGRESIDDGSYPLNSLSQPSGLAALKDKLYFVDAETSSLRVFEDDGITTLIGTGLFDFGFKDGVQGMALLQHPLGIWADEDGILIADSYNHSIRRFDTENGKISTIYGDGKRGNAESTSRFNEPNDIIRAKGNFYIADTNNHRIQIVDGTTGEIRTLDVQPAFVPEGEEKAVGPSGNLPNLVAPDQKDIAAGNKIRMNLVLKSGWKINPAAPSWMVLFEGEKPLKKFDHDTIKSLQFNLPALEMHKHYRLQGTFYFCEDKNYAVDAICRLQSYDQEFTPSKRGVDRLSIKLKTED